MIDIIACILFKGHPNDKKNNIFFCLALWYLAIQIFSITSDVFWDIRLWDFCCLVSAFEAGIRYFIWVTQSTEKWHSKNSTAALISLFFGVIHRPHCQQFSLELFSIKEIIHMKNGWDEWRMEHCYWKDALLLTLSNVFVNALSCTNKILYLSIVLW